MAGNLLTLARDLQRRKARERRGLLLAEGGRLVDDVLRAKVPVKGVLVSEAAPAELAAAAESRAQTRGVVVERVTEAEFAEVADTETPGGVLAIVEWEPLPLAGMPERAAGPLLVLDAVQDPGNVGTMIRTAFALGAWGVVALDGTADVRNAKVVRGAMGALFRFPVATAGFEEFVTWVERAGLTVLVSAADGTPLEPRGVQGAALVVGSEAHGARDAWNTLTPPPRRIAIPMRPEAESLNAAVAAGILLYELTR